MKVDLGIRVRSILRSPACPTSYITFSQQDDPLYLSISLCHILLSILSMTHISTGNYARIFYCCWRCDVRETRELTFPRASDFKTCFHVPVSKKRGDLCRRYRKRTLDSFVKFWSLYLYGRAYTYRCRPLKMPVTLYKYE